MNDTPNYVFSIPHMIYHNYSVYSPIITGTIIIMMMKIAKIIFAANENEHQIAINRWGFSHYTSMVSKASLGLRELACTRSRNLFDNPCTSDESTKAQNLNKTSQVNDGYCICRVVCLCCSNQPYFRVQMLRPLCFQFLIKGWDHFSIHFAFLPLRLIFSTMSLAQIKALKLSIQYLWREFSQLTTRNGNLSVK